MLTRGAVYEYLTEHAPSKSGGLPGEISAEVHKYTAEVLQDEYHRYWFEFTYRLIVFVLFWLTCTCLLELNYLLCCVAVQVLQKYYQQASV